MTARLLRCRCCVLALFALGLLPWPMARAAPPETPKGKSKETAASPAQEDPQTQVVVSTPLVMLLRDGSVRDELKLTSQQGQAIDALIATLDYPLWMVRDSKDAEVGKQAGAAIADMQSKVAKILQPAQQKRFDEIVLRVRGWPAILAMEPAERLKLTADQRERIAALLKPGEQASKSAPDDQAQAAIKNVLTATQQSELARLVGKPFDVSGVRGRPCRPTPIADVDEWINTGPLTWRSLEDKVVAVHFWTYGCGNCLANLPHYQAWHARLADQGLVVLGFHTPETDGERVLDAVRRKVSEHQIKYAIAIDNSGKNWNAWANRWWPSVYLVDKRGFVRYWWYGELNWQGAKGEEFMRGKIEALLAEKD